MQSSSEAVRTQPPRIAKFFILAICFLMLGRADRLHTPDACWRCSRLIQNRSAKSSRDSRAPAHELPPVPLLLSRILGFSFEVIVQLVVQSNSWSACAQRNTTTAAAGESCTANAQVSFRSLLFIPQRHHRIGIRRSIRREKTCHCPTYDKQDDGQRQRQRIG